MKSDDTSKKIIDMQRRLVVSSFGLAGAMCDQAERLSEIYRPIWIPGDIGEMSRTMFRQSREWLSTAKDATLAAYECLETAFGES